MLTMKRGVFGIAMLAAAFQTSAAGASKPVPLHGAVVRRTIHPRVVVRPVHVVRYQSAALARGKPYLGTVTTIPIRTSQQTLRYDAKHDRFIATQYSGGIYLISAQRKLSLLASGFYGNAIYDIARATVYAASGCEMIAINLQGSAHVLAGSTTCGTQDGKGPKAQFQGLSGIAIDTKDGALYATDVDRIRRIDPTTAEVTTFTPGGSIGSQYRSSNGFSLGIVYDPNDDRFYVADTPNDVIRAVASSGAVSTYTGRCVTQGSRCGDYQADGPPNVALFAAPSDVAFDAS
ncbi:MAG: hypothetical protein JO060_11925, partial [Candidatus Eremiobacteraeota bacterium]|nr:hypothetical protein [Candidatus Eremiobacteraeota bacterium]